MSLSIFTASGSYPKNSHRGKSRSSAASFSAAARHGARSASFRPSGQMTTCVGASRGGITSPLSSLCVMISPPISRVLTPQLVAQAYSSLFCSLVNFTSNALAKFCPRKCDVPACSALPSCIIASMHRV